MIASSGKGLNDLLDGSFLSLGNFEKCLSVVSSETNQPDHLQSNAVNRFQFNGKYCLLDIAPQKSPSNSNSVKASEYFDSTLNVSRKIDILFRFPETINSKIGFCLPSSCSEVDVTVLLNAGKLPTVKLLVSACY